MTVLREFLVTLVKSALGFFRHSTSYRAERHYMRGPGPACERKKSNSA